MQGRSKAKKLRFSEGEGGIYSQRGVKARGGRGRREAGRETGWRWGGSVHDRCLPGAGVGVNGVGRIFKARLAAGTEGPTLDI